MLNGFDMNLKKLLRIRVIIFLVSCFLIATSCSLKTVYSNLDYLIPAYIDNLVELDHLEELADKETLLLLVWHQKNQLPKYSQLLLDIKVAVTLKDKEKIQPEKVLFFIQKSSFLWHEMRERLYVNLAELLPLMNQQQIQELFASLEDNNKKFIKKNIGLDKAEQEEVYYKRLMSNYEEWFGFLTTSQQERLLKDAPKFTSLSKLRLTARLEWQQQTKKLLYSEEKGKTKALLNLFNRLSLKHDKLYENTSAVNREVLADSLSHIINTLGTEQKQHFIDKLDYYIELIDSLKNHKWT